MKSTLVIGASSYIGEYLLPQVIAEWERQSPEVDLSIEISDTQKVFEKVLNGDLDAGFIAACLEDEDTMTQELVQHDELVCIAPADHALSTKKDLSPNDLRGEDFISREPGSATRMWYRERLADVGISFDDLKVIAELGSQRAVLSAVESGAGISFVPRRVAEDSIASGRIVELKMQGFTPLYGNLYSIHSISRPIRRELQQFVDFLKQNKHLLTARPSAPSGRTIAA